VVSGKMVCGKWWESVEMDSYHIRGGIPPKNHSISDPPPPTVKSRPVGGSGISTVDLGVNASSVQMHALVIHDSGPPPPSLKVE
jgi:hypothetical protein